MSPEASIEMAIYASDRKNTMMSIGEMLLAPMVPSWTSCRPIARMASRKRTAINGAVIKFMGKLSRTKGLGLPFPSPPGSCLGCITRNAARMFKKALAIGRGMKTGIWNGKRTTRSDQWQRS